MRNRIITHPAPTATTKCGSTEIITKANYQPTTVEPKSEWHTPDMHTQWVNRIQHASQPGRIGFKY